MKNSKTKKLLTICISIIFTVAIVGVGIVMLDSFHTQKLECESSSGRITITHDSNSITGYTATANIDYDLDGQNEYAHRVGMSTYLAEFQNWFVFHTDGVCRER